MPGTGRELELRLFRDALSTAWGFRLQGGKDLKVPLSVQKVSRDRRDGCKKEYDAL